MSQNKRILIAILIVLGLSGLVLGVEALRRQTVQSNLPPAEVTLAAGAAPIYLNGRLIAGFGPADLSNLQQVSFVEPVEGKSQDGWLLRDVLLLYIPEGQLQPTTAITVSSSSRDKSTVLTWQEVADPQNWVMFDLSNRGTLKLVSALDKLDSRDEWVQDADKIEVTSP
jgi:hypothetical protein